MAGVGAWHHLCKQATTLHVVRRPAAGLLQQSMSDPVDWQHGQGLLSPGRKELTFPTFEESIEASS